MYGKLFIIFVNKVNADRVDQAQRLFGNALFNLAVIGLCKTPTLRLIQHRFINRKFIHQHCII